MNRRRGEGEEHRVRTSPTHEQSGHEAGVTFTQAMFKQLMEQIREMQDEIKNFGECMRWEMKEYREDLVEQLRKR